MGLLTGSYIGIVARQMKLRMNHKIQSIQMELLRTQKQIDAQQKMLDSQQRNMETMLNAQSQQSIFLAAQRCGVQNPTNLATSFIGTDLTDEEKAAQQANLQKFSSFQQQIQYAFANAKNTWLNYFESIKEATLEPLKNKEIRLQQEIQTTKDRLETYDMMAQTADKQKQDGKKDFMPS